MTEGRGSASRLWLSVLVTCGGCEPVSGGIAGAAATGSVSATPLPTTTLSSLMLPHQGQARGFAACCAPRRCAYHSAACTTPMVNASQIALAM
jgi:hypothetical protein